MVRIEAVASYRAETGSVVDGFRITRVGGDSSQSLSLNLIAGGTAVSGRDYTTFPASVTLPPEADSVIIPFESILNGIGTGDLTVSLTLDPDPLYLAATPTAQFTLEDLESPTLPRVSVTAPVASAAEEETRPATLRFTRTGKTTDPLTISLAVGGKATAGRFQPLASTLTIPSGAQSADLAIIPLDDALPQLTETVQIEIASAAGYIIGNPSSGEVTILDNDILAPPTVSHALVPGSSTASTQVTIRNPATVPQSYSIGFPDGSNYSWSDSTQANGPSYEWLELAGGANASSQISELNDRDDRVSLYTTGQIGGPSGGIPIGFAFPFYGVDYTDLRVSTNGVLYFGGQPALGSGTNNPLPTDNINNYQNRDAAQGIASLAFYWDDLHFRNSGYSTPSTAWFARPDANTFVLQFQDVRHHSDDTKTLSCQVTIKSTGEITIAYKEISIPFSFGATIGVQGTGAAPVAAAMQVSHNANFVRSGMAVRLRPGITWLSGSPANLTIPAESTGTFEVVTAATGLSPADYQGFVHLASDLATQPELTLPVALSITDTAPPANPSGLVATAVSSSAIELAWLDGSVNETAFVLERSTLPGSGFAPIANLPADTTSYPDSGLAEDTVYYYRVRATNANGPSAYSATASALTPGLLPGTLRLRWTFDEPVGNALATNSTGAFPAGAGVFSTNTPGVPARREGDTPDGTGNALDLSGNSTGNDRVRAVDSSGSLNSLENFTAMTLTFWTKVTAPSLVGNERIVSKCAGVGGYELMMSGTPSAARLNLNLNNQSHSAISTGSVNLTEWTFVAVVWTGGSDVTYYSGTASTTATVFGNFAPLSNGNPTSFTANTAAFQVGGRDGVSGDRTAAGLYDDVRVYGSALTLVELDIIRQQALDDPYFQWRLAAGIQAEIGDDHDADGIPDFAEYSLGLNPVSPDDWPISSEISGEYLTLTVTKSNPPSGINFSAQVSDDLSDWQPAVTLTDDGMTFRARDTTPIDPSVSRRFIRLKITR